MNWQTHRDVTRVTPPETARDARMVHASPHKFRLMVHAALSITMCALLLVIVGVQPAFAQDDEALADEIAAIRALPPTWTDSFRIDDGTWEVDNESENSQLQFVASTYRVLVLSEQIYAWGIADFTADNLLVEVDGYSIDGNPNNEFGIVLRQEDSGNFYTFLASNDGTYTVRRLENEQWVDVVPWAVSDLIDQSEGAVNRVGAYANGTTLALLINGEIVATVEDETFSGGAVGLAAGSFTEGGIEIAFDDLSVWDLDNLTAVAPEQEPSADATPEPTETLTEDATEEVAEEATEEAPTADVTPELPEAPTPEAIETPVLESVASLLRLDLIRNAVPTYSDEFRRNLDAWYLPNDETTETEIASRELSVRVIDANWMGWARLDESPAATFLVEVDATQTDGAPEGMLGILFHFIDDANFDFFAVSADGNWAYWRLVENEWVEVQGWTPSDALELGLDATNRLGVLVEDGTATLLINDIAVGDFADDATEPGKFALGVGTLSEGDATVVFDNFDLWSLDGGALLEPAEEATPEVEAVEPTEEETAEATVEVTEEVVEEATEEPAEEVTEEATEEAVEEATEEPSAAAEETPEVAVSGDDLFAQIAALQAETPLFASEFRRDDGEWSPEIDEDVDHYYQSRQLHLLVDRDNWLTISNSASASAADFLAEVDATQTAGPEVNEFGIAFRVVDANNFYAFFVSGNGYWNLSKFEGGEWVTLSDWSVSEAIAASGEANRLGVLADGEDITLLINGEQVGTVTDASFAEGGIALLVGTFDDPGVDVAFDNFALWEIRE